MTIDEHLVEIEKALYEGLEALERRDLIRVRQCSGYAQSLTNDVWRLMKRGPENDQNQPS